MNRDGTSHGHWLAGLGEAVTSVDWNWFASGSVVGYDGVSQQLWVISMMNQMVWWVAIGFWKFRNA